MASDSDLCKVVGRNIRKAREDAEMTQVELAKIIHTTQSQIGKYERGEQDMTLTRLIQISNALNVQAIDLIVDR